MTETQPQDRHLGYARVSTYGQTLDSQLEQLYAAGCSSRNIYREKAIEPRERYRRGVSWPGSPANGSTPSPSNTDR